MANPFVKGWRYLMALFGAKTIQPITILSQIGLILLMFQIGLEFDFSHLSLRKNRTAVIRIAAAGLIFPFCLGLAFGYYSAPVLSPNANPTASALFTATAFSIAATSTTSIPPCRTTSARR